MIVDIDFAVIPVMVRDAMHWRQEITSTKLAMAHAPVRHAQASQEVLAHAVLSVGPTPHVLLSL
jgi:hypothetical protein